MARRVCHILVNIRLLGRLVFATRLSTTFLLVRWFSHRPISYLCFCLCFKLSLYLVDDVLVADEGADPDAQDTYGNTVLHMVVIVEQLGEYFLHLLNIFLHICQACLDMRWNIRSRRRTILWGTIENSQASLFLACLEGFHSIFPSFFNNLSIYDILS